MTKDKQEFNVIVGFDFSENADLALSEAFVLASLNKIDGVHVIGVLEQPRALGRVRQSHITFQDAEEAQKLVAEAVHDVAGRFDIDLQPKTFVHTRIGDPTREIISLAHEMAAGLIIVGTHGRKGLQRVIMGSVAEKIVRFAPCPVLVMRPTEAAEDADEEFQPEPPCEGCVAKRNETDGASWWCDAHAEDADHPHPYSYSGAVKKTGVNAWEFYNR